MKKHKYKIGDLVTEVRSAAFDGSHDLLANLPAQILDCVDDDLYVVLASGPCSWAPNGVDEPEAYKFMKENGSHIRCLYLSERNIIKVSSGKESSYPLGEPLKVDKESSLYDIVRAETRERIRQEEECRPKNSAFEFL